MSAAAVLASLALLVAADPPGDAGPPRKAEGAPGPEPARRADPAQGVDPCRAAAAPLPRTEGVPKDVSRAVEAYRLAWRRACERGGVAQVPVLLGDADVLVADARTSRSVRAIAAGVLERGEPWPLPAIRPVDGDLALDWEAFAPLGARGDVDDVRFWRGAAVAADGVGGPAWLREDPEAPGMECVRLGQTAWADVARALDDMEAAGAPQYVERAVALRARLDETLDLLARGPIVCGCLRGDPLAGLPGLAAIASEQRRTTRAERELAAEAAAALEALRSGRVRVRWLRDAPGAKPIGCAGP